MKLLTISVAAYNVEAYICKTLDSLKDERFSEWLEVIIVDDGSSDSTYNTALKYENAMPDVFRVLGKENGGYGSTINAALREAKGLYFKTVDGDDWVDVEALYGFLKSIADNGLKCDLLFSDYAKCIGDNEPQPVKNFDVFVPGEILSLADSSPDDITFTMHNIAVRTELLRDNKVTITEKCFYTDTEFLVYSVMAAKTMCYLPYTVYQYRLGRSGQSVELKSYQKNVEMLKKVCMRLCEDYAKSDMPPRKKAWIRYILRRTSLEPSFSVVLSLKNPGRNLRELDRNIKDKSEDLYFGLGKRPMVAFVRKSNYALAGVVRIAYLTYRKIVG